MTVSTKIYLSSIYVHVFIGSSDSEDEADCVPSCNNSLIDHQSVIVSEESVMEPPVHSTCQGKKIYSHTIITVI